MLANFMALLDPGTHPNGSGPTILLRINGLGPQNDVLGPQNEPLGPRAQGGPFAQGPAGPSSFRARGTRLGSQIITNFGKTPVVYVRCELCYVEVGVL